jgi:uncharacterized protein YqjF (DUF2071 family)
MSFLSAEWRKLAIANYSVDPQMLEPYLPYGTELDLWEGHCYVSLVGFMFLDTRLLGIKVPFHVNFEEVNLRFYVKRFEDGTWKRGVVFIKELVPKLALSLVANWVYNENYETLPMSHQWLEQDTHREVVYRWKKGGQWQSFQVKASLDAQDMPLGSEPEFITEHYWGYARKTPQRTNEYEVTHPRWQVYTVQDYKISVDFKLVYGPDFAALNNMAPASVMLAEGSKITVEPKKKIKA